MKVITERGLFKGSLELMGLGGKASKVKRFKGWNLRPDGEVTKLHADWTLTLEDEKERRTDHRLQRVMKGGLVAFETDELLRSPMGPIEMIPLMEPHPIRTLGVELQAPGRTQVQLNLQHTGAGSPLRLRAGA